MGQMQPATLETPRLLGNTSVNWCYKSNLSTHEHTGLLPVCFLFLK